MLLNRRLYWDDPYGNGYDETQLSRFGWNPWVVVIGGFGLAGSGLIGGPLALATAFSAKKAHGVLKAGDCVCVCVCVCMCVCPHTHKRISAYTHTPSPHPNT